MGYQGRKMIHDEIKQAVTEVVVAVLKCEPREEISRASNPEWDSFSHVEIVLSLEEEFQFEFPRATIQDLDSISALVKAIVSHESG